MSSLTNVPARVAMTADAVGGVWSHVLELAKALSQRNVDVTLLVLGPPPSDRQRKTAGQVRGLRFLETGLPLDWTARTPQEIDGAADELHELAREMRADLVHLHAPGHVGVRQWRLPLVVTAHSCVATWWRAVRSGPLPLDLAWRAERTRLGLERADAVIVPSRSFAREIGRVYGLRRSTSVIANAAGPVAPARGMDRDCIFIAGRLWDPAKGAAVVDEACRRLGRPIHAAGSLAGPHGEACELRHLTLLGHLERGELRAWYDRAAIFVSMARYEPFGLCVLEAAQSGCALVLSDIPTFRELWEGAALFVPADDAEGLADAIRRLGSGDGAARADLGRRARARAAEFSVARQVVETLEVYRTVMSASAFCRSSA